MPFIDQLAQQAAGNTLGAGMGLILGGIERKKQLQQQEKLQKMQIAGQQQMGIFNREQQMKLWEDTNYKAQMGQLQKAGLNPGLMYGMGGGGGATTNAQPGNVSGGQARQGGEAAGMGIAMGQAAMQATQIELMKAEANKANADADATRTGIPNIPKQGVKLDTEIKSLTQGIENSKAQQRLTEIEGDIAEVRSQVAGKTQNMQIAMYETTLRQATKELEIMGDRKLLTATEVKWKETQIKYELANVAIDTYLKSEEAKGIQQNIRESLDRMKTAFQNRLMQTDQQSNQNMGTEQDILNQSDIPEGVRMILNAIGIGAVMQKIAPGAGKPTETRGFHKRD